MDRMEENQSFIKDETDLTSKSNIVTFSTYESKVYGFSFDYPSNWIKNENSSFFVVGFNEIEELPYPSINVQIIDLAMFSGDASDIRIDQFQQMIMGQILRVGGKPSSFTDERIGGEFNGRSIIYYIPNNNMKSKQSFFFHKGFVYVISFTSKADEIFQQSIFIHDHAISSFTIIKTKGYKYLHLSQKSISLKIQDAKQQQQEDDSTLYLEYYSPKDWENLINSNYQKHIDPKNKLVSFMVSKESNKPTSGNLPEEDIEISFNYLDGMGNKFKLNGKVIKGIENGSGGGVVEVYFEFDNVWIKIRLTVPMEDIDDEYVMTVFNRFLNYFGIISKKNLKLRLPNIPYDIFDNLLIGYNLNIPKSFELSSTKPSGEVISFKDKLNAPDLSYVVRLVVEDISNAGLIKLHEYSNDVISKILELQPESKLLTQEPGFIRLDKHLASTVSIQSFDPEIRQHSIQLIATSVQKSHGIVITIRTKATEQFNLIYKKSFYIFDTFKYYKN